jgi:hypothetical protein
MDAVLGSLQNIGLGGDGRVSAEDEMEDTAHMSVHSDAPGERHPVAGDPEDPSRAPAPGEDARDPEDPGHRAPGEDALQSQEGLPSGGVSDSEQQADNEEEHVGCCSYATAVIFVIGLVGTLVAIAVSTYCLLLAIATFCSTSLVGFVVTPLFSVFDRDPEVIVIGILRIIAYVPIVAYILYIFMSLIVGIADAMKLIGLKGADGAVNWVKNHSNKSGCAGLSRQDWINMALAWGLAILCLVLTFLWRETVLLPGLVAFGVGIAGANVASFFVAAGMMLWVLRAAGKQLLAKCKPDIQVDAAPPSDQPAEASEAKAETDPNEENKTLLETYKTIFLDIGTFARSIAHELESCPHLWRHALLILIFIAVNIVIIDSDCLGYIENRTLSFLTSIVLRCVFLPAIAFFHPLVPFLFKCESTKLKISCYGAFALSVAVIIAVIGVVIAAPSLTKDAFRLSNLPPVPNGWTNAPEFDTGEALCNVRYEGLSVVEAIGLALGGYDIDRDQTVFDHQLKYFFGPSATDISYSHEWIVKDVPVVIYNISGTTVFGFRGFSTGREVALQLELLSHHYGVPIICQLSPLYQALANSLLSVYVPALYNFGIHFFSAKSPFDAFLQGAQAIYDDYHLTRESKVVFVGANTGGVIAKVLGMLTHHRGIGFISMPGAGKETVYRYDIGEKETRFLTNVFSLNGVFGVGEVDTGEDFAIPGSFDLVDRDAIYMATCNLAEMCGHHDQFEEYCTNAIGADRLKLIRDYFR